MAFFASGRGGGFLRQSKLLIRCVTRGWRAGLLHAVDVGGCGTLALVGLAGHAEGINASGRVPVGATCCRGGDIGRWVAAVIAETALGEKAWRFIPIKSLALSRNKFTTTLFAQCTWAH